MVTGREYIGQTIRSPRIRWKEHCWRISGSFLINRAIAKYGADVFEFSVLAKALSIDELNILEQSFIKERNSLSPNGYNLTIGGMNCSPTSEVRRKLSAALKGKTKGPMSELTKLRVGASKSGRILSPEHRAKLKGNRNHSGHPHSKEAKDKMSLAHKGRTAWNKGISTGARPASVREKISASMMVLRERQRNGKH